MKKHYIIELIFLICFAIASELVLAKSDYKVVDGDSLEKGNVRIRLIDIDAPELFQECEDENGKKYDCGFEAKKALEDLVYGGVSCESLGKDKYNRQLMKCFDGDEDINAKMVENGWALAYDDKYQLEEALARKNKNGIWKGKFMRPELYRALQKAKENQKKVKKR